MVYDVIIVGAGAAGAFCGAAFDHKVRGMFLEKSGKPCTKLLISGSGSCNVTHGGSIKDFVVKYGAAGRSIRRALYAHSNRELVSFLNDGGVKTFVRDDGKVFPQSMDAGEIRDLLLRKIQSNGFEIKCNSAVTAIVPPSDDTDFQWMVKCSRRVFYAKNLVVACGGCSFPATGSDGSIFQVLKRDLGVVITPLIPALSPLGVENYPYAQLSGISFQDARCRIFRDGRVLGEETGGLLLTHKDFSGPAVMNISKYCSPGDTLHINYLGDANFDTVFAEIKKGSAPALPKRFYGSLQNRYGPSSKALAKAICDETFKIKFSGSFKNAMATSGGIALDQMDTGTFQFEKYPHLYAIGEVLDVDGVTGGYNIQFAYSSGISAALHISRSLNR